MFPCVSVSTIRTRRERSWQTELSIQTVCVFPTPPFKLITVMTFAACFGAAFMGRILPLVSPATLMTTEEIGGRGSPHQFYYRYSRRIFSRTRLQDEVYARNCLDSWAGVS